MEDITTHIYSPDHEALDCLRECYRSVREKYPDSDFMLKEDTSYYIRMTLDSGLPMRDLYRRIMEIAHLFALFFYRSTYPESITIVKHPDTPSDLAKEMEVYPSLSLNKETIKLTTEKPFLLRAPISVDSIDLGTVLAKWFDEYKHLFRIISLIQHETGFRIEHDIYRDIMLYATELEWISGLRKPEEKAEIKKKRKKKKNAGNDKYEYPVEKSRCQEIRDGLQRIFCVSDSADDINHEIGEKISDLRNDIAHANREKTLLNELKNEDIDLIGQYLHLTIIGFVLDRIGVDKDIVDQYQQHFCP